MHDRIESDARERRCVHSYKVWHDGLTPLGVLRKEAYEEANKFASAKGMLAEVISVNEVPTGFARWPQVDLRFRLVNAAERQPGGKAPGLTITKQAGYDAMGNPTTAEISAVRQMDFYTELKKANWVHI